MLVDQAIDALVVRLQPHPVADGAEIVAEMDARVGWMPEKMRPCMDLAFAVAGRR